MGDRNLTTTVRQVFGDVSKGTECRICGRNVTDGRSKYCSDYCRNLANAVMDRLNWTPVRRRIIERDGETCQVCGFDRSTWSVARGHVRDLIDEHSGEHPEAPSMADVGSDLDTDEDWQAYLDEMEDWRERREELRERYGQPKDIQPPKDLEVDHIQPVSEGGHPFDPGNLQTLCEDCHQEKTAMQAGNRPSTPTIKDLNESICEYL